MMTVIPGTKLRFWPALVAVLAALAPHAASAQSLTSGAVDVRLVDPSGQAVGEVLLALEDTAAGVSRTGAGSREGRFRFDGVPPGEYTLRAERIGFSPRRITGIRVRPERVVSVRAELTLAAGDVNLVQQPLSGGVAPPAGASQWIPRSMIRALPGPSRDIDEVLRFTSSADEFLSVEGLPAGLSSLAVDGMTFRTPSHPSLIGEELRRTAFSVSGFDAAQLMTSAVDVEWAGTSAALLSAYSRRGPGGLAGDVSGTFSSDAMAVSEPEGGSVPFTDIQGGATLRGALPGEDNRFSIGVSGRSRETAVGPAWPGSEAAARLIESAPHLDAAYASPAALGEDAFSGFAHIDWSLADAHRVEASVHGASLAKFDVVDARSGGISEMDGTDLLTNIVLRSETGARSGNELSFALTSSERAHTADDDIGARVTLVGDGIAFGSRPDLLSARDAQLRVSDAFHYRAGSHTVKAGGAITLGAYRYEPVADRPGEYLYGDVDQFFAGTGVFARTEGAAPVADWTDRTFALFIQDRYAAGNGIELTGGVRLERQTLPSDVRRDTTWARLTFIANDIVDEPGLRLSPRAALSWDVGQTQRWVLHASGGIFYDRLDPLLLANWQSDDGTSSVRRVIGSVALPPDGAPGGTVATRLTLLGPGFEAPRTLRGTAGMVSQITPGTTLSIAGVMRRTQNLPRRTDVNLVPLPAFHDQHGRAVFGTLVQQAGLLAALPGSNRRFTDYDEVAAMTADGTSDHWGITAGVEHDFGAALIAARYTFGRTTDDWFGAAGSGWSEIVPAGVGDAWVDATSDLDVPHRAVIGAVVTGPIGMRLGASYRVQSGRPFTPGFRPGVDANGDGSAYNDPAFVDESVPGMAELIGSASCLRESAGEFAARNSCRGKMIHALDVSLELPVLRVADGYAALMVDAFDLLESGADVPDAALYLVDPAGTIVTDPVARTVTLPLIANPGFGEPLARRMPGRRIRLGLSFNW